MVTFVHSPERDASPERRRMYSPERVVGKTVGQPSSTFPSNSLVYVCECYGTSDIWKISPYIKFRQSTDFFLILTIK
jgi:hypothetical protein